MAVIENIPSNTETMATHTFSAEGYPTILMEHHFNLEEIESLGVPIIKNMESCGIRGYFNLKE